MRTTIDLPDDLAKAAKIKAAERGESLKEMLTRAIAREVGMGVGPDRSRVVLPLVAGGSTPVVDVTNDDIAAALAAEDERYAQ